jgi:hypothetical protein
LPQTKADKLFFEFTGGINTEVSPLSFPDGISLDEENFELMADGTRRRRRGLRLEEDGEVLDTSALALGANSAFSYHRWSNVAGDPTLQFVVVQIGSVLYFYEDSDTLSMNPIGDPIDLSGFGTDTDAAVSENPVTFADGNGILFVAGPYMEPLSVEYDSDVFTVEPIDIRVRDFKGIDTGLSVTTQPNNLSASHSYNLLNRGWTEENIIQYELDVGVYPAKNQVPWLGYRRLIDALYAEADGIKEWSSDKLEAEVFGSSSAPQGALFLNPFDTRNSAQDDADGELEIVTWSITGGGTETWAVTVEVTAHGFVPTDEVDISGNKFYYNTSFGNVVAGNLNGTQVITSVPDANHFVFSKFANPNFTSFNDQFNQLGFVDDTPIPKAGGIVIDERPQAVAWHASRAFWAGVNHPEWADTIFFSQITQKNDRFGVAAQENDPTAEHLNATLPTDGGTIQVPGMGGVLRMVPFGSSLYVFATLGIWEIGPGQEGFFSATGYSVRKVADIEATSVLGVVAGDFGIVFTSPRGIYALAQDTNSGFVVPQSLSEARVQSIWNSIPPSKQQKVQCLYDSALKRYYVFYTTDAEQPAFFYDKALTFDVVRGAFYKMVFPGTASAHIFGAVTTQASDTTDEIKKLKILVQRDTFAEVEICDMDHDDFEDFDGEEQVPFLLTGYDNIGDFQRRRQAPVCHVYMKKTETGFTEDEDELIPVNESSIFLEARWDWADRSASGKFSTPQQVYRHVRAYVPASAADTYEDGYPVVVTRNKIRGRGRALHLKFYGEIGKDAHLVGWALQYAGTARE